MTCHQYVVSPEQAICEVKPGVGMLTRYIYFSFTFFVLLLTACGGGGSGGDVGATPKPDSLDINALSYVRHSFVENSVKVPLPHWESIPSVEFPSASDEPLELEIEPISLATGQWRTFFVVLNAESADQTFSNELRNKTILSSQYLVIDGFPAEQTVYEGNITFDIDDGDGESLATPNQGGNVQDRFRFLQTTVDVNGDFYTLLYVAEVTDYVRYEEIAYHLAESMEFATRLPIQRSNAAGDLVSASTESQTLFAYCEINDKSGLPQMALNSVLLTSERVEQPETLIATFPLGSDSCSTTGLAYGDGHYLVVYASRTGQNETLVAQILDAQGRPQDEGTVLATADAVPSENTFDDLNLIYDGGRFFAAWTELALNGGSGAERRQLVGQFIDADYTASERMVIQGDLVPRYVTEYRRLALAVAEQSVGIAWSFASASAPSEQMTRLMVMDLNGNALNGSPITVRNHSGVELLDLDLAVIGSTYSLFWVERSHTPESQSQFDDRLLAQQFTDSGAFLNEFPVLVMGPLLNLQGLEYEKNRLEVNPWNDEFYFIWESSLADDGNRYASKAYGVAVDSNLSSRSEPEVMEYASVGLFNLTLIHYQDISYMTWLPAISANHAQVWVYSRDAFSELSWLPTESYEQ